VVGGHRSVGDAGRPVRSDIHRGPPAAAVQYRDVVGHVHRNFAQDPHRLVDGPADLKHVADGERDAEALADLRPASERQRDGEPGVVDSVQQPPQAVEHAEYPAAGVGRLGHHPVEQAVVPVIVADPRWPAVQDGRL